MKLAWSAVARHEMIELKRFSIERWGREVAIRYMEDIRNAAKGVAENPRKGRLLRGDWRITRVRSHYLIIRIDDERERMIIARVLHVSMDVDRQVPD